jgi:hypothetical protein
MVYSKRDPPSLIGRLSTTRKSLAVHVSLSSYSDVKERHLAMLTPARRTLFPTFGRAAYAPNGERSNRAVPRERRRPVARLYVGAVFGVNSPSKIFRGLWTSLLKTVPAKDAGPDIWEFFLA